MARAPKTSKRVAPRRSVGRVFARILCVIFALVGALPLAAGFVLRSEPMERWASNETARVLRELVGVEASFRVEVALWPLHLAVRDVRVESTDGGEPLFRAERVQVTPRLFSLLGGRLDVGDIEIDGPHTRLIFKDGKLQNFSIELPETEGAGELDHAPFASIAITDAVFDVEVDSFLIRSGAVDLDVFADDGAHYDVALRIPKTTVENLRTSATDDPSFDEDVLCQLDLRASIEPGSVLVRRLSVLGAADLDPEEGTTPRCTTAKETEDSESRGRVALSLSQFQIQHHDAKPTFADGRVVVRAPLDVINRYVDAPPIHAWVGFTGSARYEPANRLPTLDGSFRVSEFRLADMRFVEHAQGEVHIDKDVVQVPRLAAGFGGGDVELTGIRVEPFATGLPLSVTELKSSGVSLQGLLRDIGITPRSWVRWEWPKLGLRDFRGTIEPLHLEGTVRAHTTDFTVFDRGYEDPARERMVGIPQAELAGRFAVEPDSIQFKNFKLDFDQSSVLANVAVGFASWVRLDVGEGSHVNLADLSPIANLPVAGLVNLTAKMDGYVPNVLLKGNLGVKQLVIDGFPVGDIDRALAEFAPLKLRFRDLVGTSGGSDLVVPALLLDFESDAGVLLDGTFKSRHLHLDDFYKVFHLDADPRWKSVQGTLATNARVTFVSGGPRDPCLTGHLRVAGDLDAASLELFGERFHRSQAEFDLDWTDLDAGFRGFRLDVPSVTLRKGGGAILGGVQVRDNGVIQGNLVGSGIPLSSVQVLGNYATAVDGTFSTVAEIDGTLDALHANVQSRVGSVQVGGATLPPSHLSIELKPLPDTHAKTAGTTECGHKIPAPFDPATYEPNRVDAVFHVDGQFFGGQLRTSGMQITQAQDPHLSGNLELRGLDLGNLAAIAPSSRLADSKGRLSALIAITDLPLKQAGAAKASLSLREFWFDSSGLRMDVREARNIDIDEGTLALPGLALVVTTSTGQKGIFDVSGKLTELGAVAKSDLTFRLRRTPLATFASLWPRVEHTEGQLSGQIRLSGPLTRTTYRGAVELDAGALSFRGFPLPLTDMNVAVSFEPGEIRVVRAGAKLGGGTLTVTGAAPLHGSVLGAARGQIILKNVGMTPVPGVSAQLDAVLAATWDPKTASDVQPLPRVAGDVTVRSFEYARPVTLTADLASLTKRGRRTTFESYDPRNDVVEFDVSVHSAQPLLVRNNLAEASFVVDTSPGLRVAGTNQRFGARGDLRFEPGGRIRLRRNQFEIRQGTLRFDDLTRLARGST